MPWLVYQFVYSLLGVYFAMMLGERSGLAAGSVPLSIYWNSSNEIFKSSSNNHIIEVKLEDSVNIVCPHYPKNTKESDMEFYIIYNVNKTAYENCQLGDHRFASKMALTCNKPTRRTQSTFLILPFSPIPNSLEFPLGKSQYFITTSVGTKDEIDNRNHGACKEKNMKLIIKVIRDSSTTKPHITSKSNINSKTKTTTESDWSNLIDSTFPTRHPPKFKPTPKTGDKSEKYKPDPMNGNKVPHQAQIGAASQGQRLSHVLLMCSLIFGLLSWWRTFHR